MNFKSTQPLCVMTALLTFSNPISAQMPGCPPVGPLGWICDVATAADGLKTIFTTVVALLPAKFPANKSKVDNLVNDLSQMNGSTQVLIDELKGYLAKPPQYKWADVLDRVKITVPTVQGVATDIQSLHLNTEDDNKADLIRVTFEKGQILTKLAKSPEPSSPDQRKQLGQLKQQLSDLLKTTTEVHKSIVKAYYGTK